MEYVDLSVMLEPKVAIHCESENEARILVDNFITQFPARSVRWSKDETHYDSYESDTCYSLFIANSVVPRNLMYGSLDFQICNNFRVIEFSHLPTIWEVEESDFDIDFLIGG